MSTNALNTLKKWSLLGILAVASGFGCAAGGEDATYDDAFGDDGEYLDIEGEDGKNDGDDVDQVYSKYKAGANLAYKYVNLRANGTFDFVLNSRENRGLGTTLTGTYRVSDDLLNQDGADHYFMVAMRFTGVKNATTSSAYGGLIGQVRDFEFTIPNDWGQENWVKIQRIVFSGRSDARGKPIVAERGPLIKLDRCLDCALSDYDDEAIHDDDNFKVIVSSLKVKPYKDGDFGTAFPTKWDNYNNEQAAPDLQVCAGAFCSNTLNDVQDNATSHLCEVAAGSFNPIGTIKGEALRAGFIYKVVDNDGFTFDVIGQRRVPAGFAQLHDGAIGNIAAIGRFTELKIRLEQVR
jgi:hypothetical protein